MKFKYPQKLDKIFAKLISYGARVVIVGGFVRDSILGINSLDIDVEIYQINSFEMLESILDEFGSVNSVGKSFGVCKLDFDELKLDFTLPRSDSKVADGHLGFEVKIDTSLDYKSASSRRDFTINTIGYDVVSKTILDPFGGVEDLQNRFLKVVDAHKFGEDPLRILRAMQFCARFDLSADDKLVNICKTMCHQNVLKQLPQERIFEEFSKLFLKSHEPSIGLEFLKEIEAFNFFNELVMEKEKWHFTLKALDRCTKNITLKLAVVCFKMDEKNTDSFVLKLTNQKKILREIKQLHHIANFLQSDKTTLKYSLTKDINLDILKSFLDAIDVKRKDLQSLKPKIHGKDLIKLGFKPSKEFSNLLQMVYEMQLIQKPK